MRWMKGCIWRNRVRERIEGEGERDRDRDREREGEKERKRGRVGMIEMGEEEKERVSRSG